MEPIELLKLATDAAEHSYSPYSHFPVGAAVLTNSGKVYTGCNIENASLGLTLCAERTAIFKAVSSGDTELVMLACTCIKGEWNDFRTLVPCGACRQVMTEFMKDDAPVIIGVGTDFRVFQLQKLLPEGFRLTL